MKIFQKVLNRAKQSTGLYKLLSYWTAANTVEFDSGETLEECKASMTNTLNQKGDGLFYDSETNYLYLLSGENRISGVEITTGGTGEVLGDVSDVVLTPDNTSVTIKWTDPQDGDTVQWGGTTVIRKQGSRPVDCLDGDVVVDITTRNQYRTTGYVDSNLQRNTTYWYRWFPYSTQGQIRTGLAVATSTLKDETVIDAFPTVSGTYTYTGSEQSVVLDGYDAEKMVIQSGNTGTNAGDYRVALVPKTGLKWPDGSTDTYYLDWTIYKALVTVLPAQSGTVTYTGTSRTPSWNYYDENQLAITGETSGTAAGVYTAIFTPTSNYQWGDGTTTGKNVQWVIQKASITVIPTQKEILNYTGSTLSPTWNNYDSEKLTISGQTSGVDAGQYIAVFTPTSNYRWSDGTTGGKEVQWTIENNSIGGVPSQSGTLTYNGSSQSPTWTNYDSEKLTLSGDTSGTNAGSYTATFTPKAGYTWSDGTSTAKDITWTINRATITNYPSQSGTLSYTGSSQSPSWNYYDSTKMTRSGTTSATNAGTYTATFTPTSNYQWSGGSTSARSVSWTIDKITDTLSLSKQTMSFSATDATDTSTASGYHGTLSVTTSNSSVATATVSGSTITVTCKGTGSATITVTSAATTNYYETVKSISVSASTAQKISYIPSQSGTLTYNGSSQSPTWSNYSSSQLTIGGTTSGTNAGTYTATFTPKSGYTWSDGTTSTKSVNWVIGKGTLNFSVSPTSVSVDVGSTVDVNLSGYTYTYNSTDGYWPNLIVSTTQAGIVKCDFVNTSSSTGAKLRIIGQSAGSVTVTVRTSDNNYNQVTKTVSVTVNASQGEEQYTKDFPDFRVQHTSNNYYDYQRDLFYPNNTWEIDLSQESYNGTSAWWSMVIYTDLSKYAGQTITLVSSNVNIVGFKVDGDWPDLFNGDTKRIMFSSIRRKTDYPVYGAQVSIDMKVKSTGTCHIDVNNSNGELIKRINFVVS